MEMNDAMSECCVRLGLGNKGEPKRNVRESQNHTGQRCFWLRPWKLARRAIGKLMNYVKDKYNNPKVYISENGVAGARKDSLDLDVQLNEACQIIYDARHLY
ncbi:hypothetical protein GBA52_027223 [Prunus armeniaca]|nr:hypothetical protein GBA52_027223 [Prunus armeniaca]